VTNARVASQEESEALMKRSTRTALAIVTMLAAGCGGRVASGTTDGSDSEATGTTFGGPTAKQSGSGGQRQGQQGSDSSGGAFGSGGDSSNGGSSSSSGSSGNGSANGGTSNTNGSACSVVLTNLFGNFSNVAFDDVTGGGISEGAPFQVGCNFSDASNDYSFSATFVGGATTGQIVTTDARVTRASRTCQTDCPYDTVQLPKCDFTVSVASARSFVGSFQCSVPGGEDMPPASVNGSMNVMLVPDTLK
jgi:hypothetical protein